MSARKKTLHDDTIAALATAAGRAGVGMVRVSGPRALNVAQTLLGRVPEPRYAVHGVFRDAEGREIDDGIALYFPAPHSFTGEHVLELHGHGGPVVMDMLLQAVITLGVRLARPGEFSERAFLNGKLDLAQAEAVADLIDSSSRQAARSALRSLQGEFSSQIHHVVGQLIELRSYVEAAIDFSEEDIDFLSDGHVIQRLEKLIARLRQIQSSARQGCLLNEGITVVIAGPPNAGKSSLLNRLAQRETAIVTEVPGTTRDVVRERITIDGLPLHVIDTAGLHDSSDPVEQIGIQRARQQIGQADMVVLVFDDQSCQDDEVQAIVKELPTDTRYILVRNKIDLSGRAAELRNGMGIEICLSVETGQGLDLLTGQLKKSAGFSDTGEETFIARRRHVTALQCAADFLEAGYEQLMQRHAAELLAEDLHQAQQALGEITGEFSSDDLLGRIFSSFCIGK